MHIVLIAWLYVIGMMALTSDSVLGGIALFGIVGIAPVLMIVALAVRRMRAARRERLALQQRVEDRDGPHA